MLFVAYGKRNRRPAAIERGEAMSKLEGPLSGAGGCVDTDWTIVGIALWGLLCGGMLLSHHSTIAP
jgi:hypothetical protein